MTSTDVWMRQTAELANLFSTTLQSLAADATAVKQVRSLAHCLDISEKAPSQSRDSQEIPATLKEDLWKLEDLVTGLEEKVVALRQIVSEEKRSVQFFETTLQQEANDQAALVQKINTAMVEYQEKQEASKPRKSFIYHDVDGDANSVGSEGAASVSLQTLQTGKRSLVARSGSRRDSVDPRANELKSHRSKDAENKDPISLPRISHEELDAYKSKNIQAPRISLLDLNEALEEIEQVCQTQRHAALVLKRKQQLSGSLSSGALQRRYDYLQKRQQLSDDEADDSVTTITEQVLRENCAFFRHGESTARATLSLLCSLRRLKQVPTKNRKVIYQLLVEGNESGHP